MQVFLGLAESVQRALEPGAAGPRPWAAKDRLLEHGDGIVLVAPRGTRQRGFEQSQQRHRFESAESRVRGKSREYAGGCIGKRLTARIFGSDIPAREGGQNTASER